MIRKEQAVEGERVAELLFKKYPPYRGYAIELGQLLDIDFSTIRNWRSRKRVSRQRVEQVRKFLGVSEPKP